MQNDIDIECTSGWWFGTFVIFPYIGNNQPNWLIFFRGVETTNQTLYIIKLITDNPCVSFTPQYEAQGSDANCVGCRALCVGNIIRVHSTNWSNQSTNISQDYVPEFYIDDVCFSSCSFPKKGILSEKSTEHTRISYILISHINQPCSHHISTIYIYVNIYIYVYIYIGI